jgi:LacI family transcriptional regulator
VVDSPHTSQPRSTMRDVAALAGVGLTTVSRVVNGKPGVDPALTARVRLAIDRLDYRHNAYASSIRRADGKTGTLGLVLEDVANPFMSALHRAVEESARDRGLLVFAGSCDEDSQRARQLIAALRTRRVDGLIVVPAGLDHSYVQGELEAGTPVVFVDRPPQIDADAVVRDDHAAAKQGTMHLLSRGHRRIAYLGASLTILTARARLQGFRAAHEGLGTAAAEELVEANLETVEDALAATRRLLAHRDPPTAIFAAQNYFTIGAIKALRSIGAQHRVGVVGFDDFPLAEMLEPAVTVVAHDPVELGRRAAALIFARLDGDRSPSKTVLLPVNLIPRGSGEIDPTTREAGE